MKRKENLYVVDKNLLEYYKQNQIENVDLDHLELDTSPRSNPDINVTKDL